MTFNATKTLGRDSDDGGGGCDVHVEEEGGSVGIAFKRDVRFMCV